MIILKLRVKVDFTLILMFNIIFAIDAKGGYGKDMSIPWKNKDDMQNFRQKTQDSVIIMGKNTWLSLPQRPLEKRINIVVSKSLCDYPLTFGSLSEALKVAKSFQKEIFIIGGASLIYEALRNKEFNKLYLTILDDQYECDRFLDLPLDRFNIESVKKITQGKIFTLTGKFWNQHDNTYLSLVSEILKEGSERQDRTGTGTLSSFGKQIKFDLSHNVPLLSTKYVPWKTCIKELLWFLKGQTDSNILSEQGVTIWNGNTSREFLDSRGLSHLPVGDIGAGYGFQWRHFGAEYTDCLSDYNDKGFDQIEFVINELKTNPHSRRIFMSAWNPAFMHKMALPPCHVSCQFYVNDSNELSCHMYQRSADVFLGLPFNIFSYSVLTYYLAKICGMKPKELIISLGDCHLYKDHINQVMCQLQQLSYEPARLNVKDSVLENTIEQLSIDDFELLDYKSNKKLYAKMSV